MKIFVTTCDKFDRILKGFTYMFNKHWSSDAEVTILGYGAPSFSLPDNFKFISLAKQQKDWTSALIPFFKQLSDEYFGLMLDDYYVLSVNKLLLHEAEEYMAEGVEKISLKSSKYWQNRDGFLGKNVNFNIAKQDFKHRLAICPQFVRRDYFLKYLKPGKTIWQYETQFGATKNDGAQILAPKQDLLISAQVVSRGKISKQEEILRIKKEDLDAMRQLGVSDFNPRGAI